MESTRSDSNNNRNTYESRDSKTGIVDNGNIVFSNIISRKLSTKSVSRHFVKWKLRYFELNRTNRVLTVVSPDKPNSPTIISLISPTVSIGRHYYSTDEYKWLWLKYFDKEESAFKEIVMKFKEPIDMGFWEKVITMYYLLLFQSTLSYRCS
jgi:hypothetical protein